VKFAGTLTKGYGSEVVLVLVRAPNDRKIGKGKAIATKKEIKLGCERFRTAEQLLEKLGVTYRSGMGPGRQAEQMMRQTEDHDLAAVGVRGLSLYREALVGNTSRPLVHGRSSSVLFVH